jgi:hypothetical protein
MKNKLIIIGILLAFGVIFCTCEINKAETNSVPDLTVIAKGSSEGIHLYIDNIPEDTTHLSVSLYNITTNDQLYTGAGFQGDELEQLRETGFLICPFVKNKHEYQITVDSFILTKEGMKTINSATITAIASGGIHIINNPTLVWNNSNNFVTLSAMPVFSNEKMNKNIGLNYGIVFRTEEIGGKVSNGFSELTNELTFDNTQNYNSIVEMIGNIGLNGDISMYADVDLTLEYEKIKWTVVFAKTEFFIFSL